MNQQRLQSYINLIQKLLACPSGEEWILLRQNEALVNPELVQVMEQVATQLANQGNSREAKFLHNLAGQIHHLFMAQTVQPAADADQSQQAYLELIKALLECPQGSEGELLAANQALVGPGLVHQMQQVATQLAASGDQEGANYLHHWATELSRLWLREHDFQPFLKQEPQPPPFPYPSVAQPTFSPQAQAPQPTPVSRPAPATPRDEEEDIWAELSGEPTPGKPQPPPSEPSPEDIWAELSEEPTPGKPQPPPSETSPTAPAQPTPVPDRAVPLPPPDGATYEQINHHLETIAAALTKLSETLAHLPQTNPDPLWYMEVLERAQAGNWMLTSEEIGQLIGVKPTCPKGDDSFQRGSWVFLKAGKLGAQTAWRVTKRDPNSMETTSAPLS